MFRVYTNPFFGAVNTSSLNSTDITTDSMVLNNSVVLSGQKNVPSPPYQINFPSSVPSAGQSFTVSVIDDSTVNLGWSSGMSGASGTIPSGVVVVSKDAVITGQRYNTLTEAVAYINTQSPGPTNRWAINVQPGIYIEPDTVTIPSFVAVTGNYGLTSVIKTSGSSHIIKASNRTDIYNLTIQGPIL